MSKFLFMRNANRYEDFQWVARFPDCKHHKATSHPIWHRWKGGYRVRGHLSPMRCYQHSSYQKRKPSFKRMSAFKYNRRNSNTVLYGRHYRFRGYY